MNKPQMQKMLVDFIGNPPTSKSVSLEEKYPGIKEKVRELGSWQLAIEWYKNKQVKV